MDRVYLDCSGLRNISVDKGNLPNSIYIDGDDFLRRLSETLQQAQYDADTYAVKQQRFELVKALASNSAIFKSASDSKLHELMATADGIIKKLGA